MRHLTFVLGLFFAIFFVSSCAKDEQRTVNRLDGLWKVSDYKVSGASLAATEFANMNFLFKGCDVGEFDYCDGTLTTNEGDEVEFKFTISDGGGSFGINFIALDLVDISGTIESSRKKQVFSFTSNGIEQVITLEPL
jgi:hypothetical protein